MDNISQGDNVSLDININSAKIGTSVNVNKYPPRVLSGIHPSEGLHLGHYFGALKQHLDLQHEYPGEAFCVIADYHYLTTSRDPKIIRKANIEVATSYLALGLNPNKAILYRQSDLPQVLELFWILSAYAFTGDFTRTTTYRLNKDYNYLKSIALLSYPLLMAADIASIRATVIPTVNDQEPNINRVRSIIKRFNSTFNTSILPIPDLRYNNSQTVYGTDGKKMSHHHNNIIRIFSDLPELTKSINNIITDSKGHSEIKDPETCNVYRLYKLVASESKVKEMYDKYETGKICYKEAKKELLLAIQEYFIVSVEKYNELKKKSDYVEDILRSGYITAAEQIDNTLDSVRQTVGITY